MRAISIAFLVSTIGSSLQAQEPIGSIPFYTCGTNDQIEKTLTEKYGEVAIFGGTSSPIHLDRYWVNEETGTWSNTRTNIQSGVTCILTSGANSRKIEFRPVLGEPT